MWFSVRFGTSDAMFAAEVSPFKALKHFCSSSSLFLNLVLLFATFADTCSYSLVRPCPMHSTPNCCKELIIKMSMALLHGEKCE